MIQGPVKYIQVDYWNYWWCVYSTAKDFSPPHWVECSLTDDADGRMPFFHFDLYNLHELHHMIREQDFIPPDHPDYPAFLRRAEALEQGEADFFVGALYSHRVSPSATSLCRPAAHCCRCDRRRFLRTTPLSFWLKRVPSPRRS